jgi:phage shock protein A
MSDLGHAALARRLYLHVLDGGQVTARDMARLVEKIEELEAVNQAAIAATSAQKAYFKNRSKDSLIASKQAEVSLDKLLAELKGETDD